jgi:GNAT superfamily N-acetyltransferase
MNIVISEEQLNKIVENTKESPNQRKTLDFFDLVSKGIVFVVEPHENGERVKQDWEHDTNLITLWNLEHPEPGQEWVKKAKHFVKNGSIKWWNEIGQFDLSDDKYNQIIKSIGLYKEKNKKDDSAKFLKCKACKKLFTQTIHKKKKSLAICPWCGKHNTDLNEDQEVDERSRSFAFTRKKRLFSKSEMMANPDRYKKYDRDLKEIDLYKRNELSGTGGPRKEDYEDAINNGTFIKQVGDFTYLYDISDEEGSPVVKINVVDKKEKNYVGFGEFEMRYGDNYFVAIPYIRQQYRNKGIATEMYKAMLDFGNIFSGKAQSQQAAGLWYKLYHQLPNKMVFVDDDGNEYDVVATNKGLVAKGLNKTVYDIKGGYLKLYKN